MMHSNFVVQLINTSGLPTFIATPNLSKIYVVPNENACPPKKPKKNYDVSHKCKEAWAIQMPWVKMLTNKFGKINPMNCMVCSFVHGKDVILGLKDIDTLEKHVKNMKVVHDMPHLSKK
jgi:hypothetical protein